MEFSKWLDREVEKRGWSKSELARRAGVVPSTVSMIISGQQQPGEKFCSGVARAFQIPPEEVFRRAGLLPTRSDEDMKKDEILFYFDQMTPQAQEHFRQIARALAQNAAEQERTRDARSATATSDALATA